MSFRWCLIKLDAVTCVEHMLTRLATSSFTQRLSLVWRWSRVRPGPAQSSQSGPGSRSKVRSKCRQWKIDLWLNYFNFLLWHWRSGMQSVRGKDKEPFIQAINDNKDLSKQEGVRPRIPHWSVVSDTITITRCPGCICMAKEHHKPVTRSPHINEMITAGIMSPLLARLSPDTGLECVACDYYFLPLVGCQM